MRVLSRPARSLLFAALGLAGGGCVSPPLAVPTYPARGSVVPVAANAPAARPAPPSAAVRLASVVEPIPASAPGLDELLALTRSRNPDLAAAAARVGEARGRMVQAGLYPNPTVGYSGNQINDGPGTAGQEGGFVSQEFVTGGKLKIAREAARYGVSAADWHAASKWTACPGSR